MHQKHTPNDTLNLVSIVGILSLGLGMLICMMLSSDVTVKHDLLTVLTTIIAGLLGFLSRGAIQQRQGGDINATTANVENVNPGTSTTDVQNEQSNE